MNATLAAAADLLRVLHERGAHGVRTVEGCPHCARQRAAARAAIADVRLGEALVLLDQAAADYTVAGDRDDLAEHLRATADTVRELRDRMTD